MAIKFRKRYFQPSRRVLITGSRNWDDEQLIFDILDKELQKHGLIIVVHGAAKGADSIAAQWCRIYGDRIMEEDHPAEWDKYGRSAGPIRNKQMVALGADVCYAFPKGISRGTRHCMKIAEEAGIKVVDCSYGHRGI